MSYLSPFTLLETEELPAPGALLQDELRQARKRWLAEFELGGNEFITLNGAQFSKTEILATLDSCSDAAQLEFHKRVAAAPELRRFLESGSSAGFALAFIIEDWEPAQADRAQELFLERYTQEVRAAWRNRSLPRMQELKAIGFSGLGSLEQRYYDFVDALHHGLIGSLREDLKLYESGGGLSENLAQLSDLQTIGLWRALFTYLDEIAEIYSGVYHEMENRKISLKQRGEFIKACKAALQLAPGSEWLLEDVIEYHQSLVEGWGDPEARRKERALAAADDDDDEERPRFSISGWIIPGIAALAIAGIIFGLWWAHRDDPPASSSSGQSFDEKYVMPTGIGRGIVYYRNGLPVPKDSVWYYKMQEIAQRKALRDSLQAIFGDSLTPLQLLMLEKELLKWPPLVRDSNVPIVLPGKKRPEFSPEK